MKHKNPTDAGFTLIEVMVALVVVAIGLGALLVATSQNVRIYQHLKETLVQQWGDFILGNSIHLKLITLNPVLSNSNSFLVLGQQYYWQVNLQSTEMNNIYYATIRSKLNRSGPWTHSAHTYTFISNSL